MTGNINQVCDVIDPREPMSRCGCQVYFCQDPSYIEVRIGGGSDGSSFTASFSLCKGHAGELGTKLIRKLENDGFEKPPCLP